MTEAEARLIDKNLHQWNAFIKKVERKAKEAERELTADEADNIQMRKAQCVVWIHQLKQAEKKGFSGASVAGSMSAGSELKTGERAVASE